MLIWWASMADMLLFLWLKPKNALIIYGIFGLTAVVVYLLYKRKK